MHQAIVRKLQRVVQSLVLTMAAYSLTLRLAFYVPAVEITAAEIGLISNRD
jgi:hypothetical protein